MICPNCGSEYREGFTRCSECDVDLVEAPPPEPEPEHEDLVEVYATTNPAIIPLLESLFDDAGIEFGTSAENAMAQYGYTIGPVTFFVRKQDEAEARAIIDSLEEPAPVVEE